MADGLEHVVGISYNGNNQLIRAFVEDHNFILGNRKLLSEHRYHENMLATSASILYRLGLYTLKPSVERIMQAKNLGIVNPLIQESEPQVYEAIKFLAVEFIGRCYEALKKSGYDATILLATLNDIKADKIELGTIASIVNDLPTNIKP